VAGIPIFLHIPLLVLDSSLPTDSTLNQLLLAPFV
jgi:hypothetical protein